MLEKMRQLVNQLNIYDREYYILDSPSVSDSEYDALYDSLKKLEKESGTVLPDSPTRRVGGQPISAFLKHTHMNRLYSLDKAVNSQQLSGFYSRLKKVIGEIDCGFTAEYKFDGLTVCLTYENGEFIKAATRGNGFVGEDVTEQVLTIKSFPLVIDYKGKIEVQGEAVMRLSVLDEYNKTADEKLKNARNAVAGAVRNLNPKVTAARKLDIYFYNINYIDSDIIKTQRQCFEFLKKSGFKVYPYAEYFEDFGKASDILDKANENRASLDVLTDGVVIKIDDFELREKLGYTDKFPRWAVAYKFDAEQAVTTVNSVNWQVGRTGKLTPLAHLESVELGGATVRRATLNNIDDVKRKNVKIGSSVLIRRSNDVIPEILQAVYTPDNAAEITVPENCESCGEKIEVKGVNSFCVNYTCPPRVWARLVHYCSKDAANIVGVSEKTAQLFLKELNLTSPYMLYELKAESLSGLEGFKDKKISNILQSIKSSKKIELASFIYALGIDGIGKKTARDLASELGSLEKLISADYEKLLTVGEVGEILAGNIKEYFSDTDNLKEIQKLKELGVEILENIKKSGALSGEKVVLTGSLQQFTRSEAAKIIQDLGGEVQSSVGKSTTLLVAGGSAGSKLDKAKKLDIKIIDEREFSLIIKVEK